MARSAARIIRHREYSPEWLAAWAALDAIERVGLRTVARADTGAAGEIVDAVQRARGHLLGRGA